MIYQEHTFIDIFAEEGKELWNGEIVTNRISAPLGTDLSIWTERDIVIETTESDDFN